MDTAFFNDYVPHLQHAFQLANQVADRRSQAEAIALAADNEILPFILLDSSLRPIYCNSGAEEMINSESILLLTRGQLRITDQEKNQQLQRLLRTCLNAADSRTLHTACDTLEVPRPDGSNLLLRVKPVHPDVPTLAGLLAGYVAVYVYDPEAGIRFDHERLCKLYSLSKAEIRVAMALLTTPDPTEVAKRCFISLHTVRSHLKSIFAKTDSQNQADLVKRLMAGPARLR
jgi:DNA-binding CsgD family transcriptional regulator